MRKFLQSNFFKNIANIISIKFHRLTWGILSLPRDILLFRRLDKLNRERHPKWAAICLNNYRPRIGGLEFQAEWLSDLLREQGYEVIIISQRRFGDPFVWKNNRVTSSNFLLKKMDLIITLSYSVFVKYIHFYLLKNNLTHLWIHYPCARNDFLPKKAVADCRLVLSMNPEDTRIAFAQGKTNDEVCYVPPFAKNRKGQLRRFRLKYSISDPYILWAGAWLAAKGVRNLCERFLSLKKLYPETSKLKLVMFGGYGKEEFPLNHPDIVVFDSNFEDLPDAIADCLFVAFNSPPPPVGYDANPIIIVETMMNGKTFIAQRGTPFFEQISNCGIIIENDDEWISAAMQLISKPHMKSKLETEAYNAFSSQFNIKQAAFSLSKMIAQVQTVLSN